jgi:hypothetical protein
LDSAGGEDAFEKGSRVPRRILHLDSGGGGGLAFDSIRRGLNFLKIDPRTRMPPLPRLGGTDPD